MSMTSARIKRLRVLIEDELKSLGEREGFSITVGNATFMTNSVTFKLKASTVNSDGSVNTEEAEAFTREARLYGLDPEMLGKTYKTPRGDFTVAGLNRRGRKFPILASNGNGSLYKFSVDEIKKWHARDVSEATTVVVD